jgi:hypothetical protein
MTVSRGRAVSIALRNTPARHQAGLRACERVMDPGESPSRAVRSGVLIHLVSLTVAGAAPALSVMADAPASRFIPRTIVLGTPEAKCRDFNVSRKGCQGVAMNHRFSV